MQAVEQGTVQRYSRSRWRSPITMVARRAFLIANGSATHLFIRPMVVMAARALGPGPTRLRLVKLAHNLSPRSRVLEPPPGGHKGPAAQPTRRAA